jgi:hypothetical protein
MRFEELAYTVNGLPVTVPFAAGLTVVHVPTDERAVWVARLLGVLEGFRAGDGASLVWVDDAGQRLRMDRDEHGAAVLSNAESGEELRYSAAHLSLDGRFDWFASIGLTGRDAAELIVVDGEVFTGAEDVDPHAVEAELAETRTQLARAQRQFRAATARCRQAEGLRGRIADLDEQLLVEPTPRLDGDGLARALARPADVPADLESLAAACRAAAQRRDDLLVRLQRSESEAPQSDLERQLTDEVEPAVVEALAGLAAAARPFDVTLDAARLECAGVTAAGIASVVADVLAEVAARVRETIDARRQPTVDANAAVEAERSRLIAELEQIEWDLPDLDHLAARQSGLKSHVATLAGSLRTGRRHPSVDVVEAMLLARAAQIRRVGRCREPLPLVVNATLGPFGPDDRRSLLAATARVAETTQVLYLTDDPDTLAWAADPAEPHRITKSPLDGVATVA